MITTDHWSAAESAECLKCSPSPPPPPVQAVLSTMRFLSIVLLVAALVLTTTRARRDRRKAAKLNSLYQAGYGDTAPPVYHTSTTSTTAAPHVDLHSKEFCVDVSAYQPVVWEEREAEECSTVFVRQCQERRQNVCSTVTETRCEVQPYTECSLGQEPQQFNKTVLTAKKFVEKKCSRTTDTVPHTKYVPECHNVTKQSKLLSGCKSGENLIGSEQIV